jgi:hypothetical protein
VFRARQQRGILVFEQRHGIDLAAALVERFDRGGEATTATKLGSFLGECPSRYHRHAALDRGSGELAHEAGLADAGLAAQQHYMALARTDGIKGFVQCGKLGNPANEHAP